MTQPELEQHRHSLAMLSDDKVRSLYREAWARCRMQGDLLPGPRLIQELVQTWKQLWNWR